MNIGEAIRRRRTKLGWTATDLFRRTGLSKSFISELECGKRGISADNLLLLAQTLGVSMDALTGLAGTAESPDPPKFCSELQRFAISDDLSMRTVLTLKALYLVIQRHREPSKRVTESEWDWQRFHDRLKDFL